MSDTGAKGRSTADEDEYSESTKTAKRVDCLWAHGSRSEKMRRGEEKTEAELATVKFQKVQKVKKASIACRPTAPVRQKKCDTWAKARGRQITLTMQIHTMQILISQILCVGKIRSRPAPGA